MLSQTTSVVGLLGRKGVNSIGLAVSHSRSQAGAWERPWACGGGAALMYTYNIKSDRQLLSVPKGSCFSSNT
ncbi:MAG: hypothetical protein GDA38_16910 [Hormoscilla sp. SP12CHS1]|nr:hypothetical protein [Hormoscilla sp. SP12CHS1]